MASLRVLTFMVVLAATSIAVHGQGAAPLRSVVDWQAYEPSVAVPKTYGTTDLTSHVINAWAFNLLDSNSSTVNGNPGGSRWMTTAAPGIPVLQAPVFLPNGARIVAMQIQGCDNSGTDQVEAALYEINVLSATETVNTILNAGTGVATNPGCAYFLSGFVNHAVNNTVNTYLVTVKAYNSATRFQGIRLFYRLQVSAPPGAATFSDVPVGHPQRPFIEALAASGITGGCGGGNYCPDQPLTRGQMAVFLAVALGLHFPN